MTDHDRNMRTLIVCFVLAMVALIPLRIVEIGNMASSEVKVLGETVNEETVPVVESNEVEVVLPNAEL